MNWYKTAQQDIGQQYNQLLQQQIASIQIVGPGQNETISIPGGQSINARNLLEQVKAKIGPLLIENHVRTIDTSPIPNPQAQGLAISHRPGIIFVDVRKIFDNARKALPPTIQTDGITADKDMANQVVNMVSEWITGELTETMSHEGQHTHDFTESFQEGRPFTSVQEGPAEQFGQKIRKQYYPDSLNY